MRQTESDFEFFVFFIFPIIILVFGLIGNIIGFILLTTRKNLSVLGPVNTYRYLFITDCICLLLLTTNNYFLNAFSFGFSVLNDSTCKIYKYAVSSFFPLSYLNLLYIFFERFLAIKFPVESNRFRSEKFQLRYLLIIIFSNCVLFLPQFFNNNIQEKVSSDNLTIKVCEYNSDGIKAFVYIAFVSENVIPFLIMLLYSVLLIYTIGKSNRRMSTFYTQREIETFKKDVRLSIMTIVMNFAIVSFNLPLIYVYLRSLFFPEYILYFCLYFYFCSFAFKFYFFLIFIPLFRQELWSVCLKKVDGNNANRKPEEIEMF